MMEDQHYPPAASVLKPLLGKAAGRRRSGLSCKKPALGRLRTVWAGPKDIRRGSSTDGLPIHSRANRSSSDMARLEPHQNDIGTQRFTRKRASSKKPKEPAIQTD